MLQSRSFPRRVLGNRSNVLHSTSWFRPPTLILTLREQVLLLIMSTGSGGRESVDLEVFRFKPEGTFSAMFGRDNAAELWEGQLKQYPSEVDSSMGTTSSYRPRSAGGPGSGTTLDCGIPPFPSTIPFSNDVWLEIPLPCGGRRVSPVGWSSGAGVCSPTWLLFTSLTRLPSVGEAS